MPSVSGGRTPLTLLMPSKSKASAGVRVVGAAGDGPETLAARGSSILGETVPNLLPLWSATISCRGRFTSTALSGCGRVTGSELTGWLRWGPTTGSR